MTVASRRPPVRARAVYQAVDPSMTSQWIADGRGDLLHPTVLWRRLPDLSWRRLTGVVEASVARRWYRAWHSADGLFLAITPVARLSRPVNLPCF
jgi:hypothetical protein